MLQVAPFVVPGKPIRAFEVSLPGGAQPKTVGVEDRRPFTKKIRRHFEETRTLGDGRKKTDMVPRDVDYVYDFTDEMRADSVRAYNLFNGSSFSSSQLSIREIGPVKEPEQEQEVPAAVAVISQDPPHRRGKRHQADGPLIDPTDPS